MAGESLEQSGSVELDAVPNRLAAAPAFSACTRRTAAPIVGENLSEEERIGGIQNSTGPAAPTSAGRSTAVKARGLRSRS